MRLEAIARELANLRNPRTLRFGLISGYVVVLCFAVLTAIAEVSGALAWHWAFGALMAAKLATNTLAWIGLRTDWFALELGGIVHARNRK